MINLFTQISKYLNIVFIAFYTYYAFRVFSLADRDKKDRIYRKMKHIIYLFHFVSYLVLFLNTGSFKVAGLYIAQVVAMLVIFSIYPWVYSNISKFLLNHMMLLLTIGYIMLTRLHFDKAMKQFAIATLSVVFCIVIPIIIEKLKKLQDFGWVFGGLGIVVLLSVLFFGVSNYGATNWISIKGFTFQPSEFVKIIFVFSIASLLSKRRDFKYVAVVTVLAAAHVLILVLEKDLGGALIFFITYLIMLYIATSQPLYFFAGLGAGSVASYLAYHMFNHVRVRVMAWKDPWKLIDNEGYQVSQSLFAIGTGGWFGMGLYQGLPTSIPVVDSDFIFSAISEEMGGFFAILLILICISCFLMFVTIAMKIQELFYKLLALGLSALYLFQVFLAIGGVTKFIPSTGVTLPLVSYGGTSILSSVIMFSIIQGLFIMNQDRNEKIEKKRRKTKKTKKS
ncbi:FtsW/RodA/SpoVE family cell cycle protein [Anaerocolumna aminovalerica]|uniref:Cell division protein FtsW, lipid II flippase n=2 Tax=Anaerocolumna aminovalerica TaxID=1527 RepID=A0A1I5J807_9FIRM|nr:FtsW/RodA/SpoVE family cell cycle protein [Anaerocolumna aminovalerica]MDU6265474.1 FtsW/RodA/SpoVE family cell cycle protein [Anaerocolumna aminovalerica]SFO68526.1 cell division protein FtsW, lipid II flippase [Anaerocolumna aminovalerica]